MITEADRAKYLPLKPAKKLTLVDKADEQVDIRDILSDMGIWTPSGIFYSYKINCPWSFEHDDGGMDKNCRLFGATNIYCWAMHGRITPTMLYSRWKGLPRKEAALRLLDERGLLFKDWRERWAELEQWRNSKELSLGSKSELVAVLHESLRYNEKYSLNEFADNVRNTWNQVLLVLDQLWDLPDLSIEHLTEWFNKSLAKLSSAAESD